MIKKFNINKSTFIFKINIARMVNKYPKLKYSLLSFNFFTTYFKDIKEIGKENTVEFK